MRLQTVAISFALIGSAFSANAQTDMVWSVEGSPLRFSITDIVRHNQGGVYGLSYNIYRVDKQGKIIPDSFIGMPQLVNCRDMTTASFNVNTTKLQIRPITMKTVREFCSTNFIALPD